MRDAPGVFNIVGDGVLPLSTVIRLTGRIGVPVPHPVAMYPSRGALWAAQLSEAPPTFLDYLRWICVADGDKARRELRSARRSRPARRCSTHGVGRAERSPRRPAPRSAPSKAPSKAPGRAPSKAPRASSPTWDFLYDRWWRVDVQGIHHVPAEGAAALVANHGGAIPFDGVMLSTALRREHPAQRQLRWLAEDFVFHMPFAGAFVNRIGAVRACQENAERLIQQGNVVALFPEGVKGIGKLYRDRYKLQRFGRGGHIKLAIRTRAPIIPVTIVGNEDTHPMLAGSDRLAKLLGVPYVPLTPTFPWLGPVGLLPLPAKWRIIFGEPIPVAHLPPEAADDELLVGRLNEKLRATIQETLDRALRERRSVFKG
jgi:1-acyl-sn-glycerol-3-phosphate acyltransferase